jgi:predicted RNA-binding protein with PUA-like domain
MNYWLLKTDPETYSWEDLLNDKKTEWTGVRSYEARNNMKKMAVGDLALFYYSQKNPRIVATVKIVSIAHPDSTDDTGMWWCVDIAPVKLLKKSITLPEVKNIYACKDMALLKKSRLSVQPVTKIEWDAVVGE